MRRPLRDSAQHMNESSLSVHLASLSGENLVWHVVDSDILVWPGRSVVLRLAAGGGDRVPE